MPDYPTQDRALLPAIYTGNRRVTSYSPDLALQIVERIAFGETLTTITASEGMPHRATFHRWVLNHAELARALSAAREMSAYAMEDEALDMARAVRSNPLLQSSATVRAYDVALTQLRWSAAKRNPRVYSERSTMAITVPIQINTSLDLGTGSLARGEELPDIYTISAKVNLTAEEKAETDEHRMGSEVDRIGGRVGPLIEDRPRGQRTSSPVSDGVLSLAAVLGGGPGEDGPPVLNGVLEGLGRDVPEAGAVGDGGVHGEGLDVPAPKRRGRPPKGPAERTPQRPARRRGHYGD